MIFNKILPGIIQYNVGYQPAQSVHCNWKFASLQSKYIGNFGNICRCQEEDLIVALDSTTGRILQCERTAYKKRFSFPMVSYCLFHPSVIGDSSCSCGAIFQVPLN